MVHDKNGAAVLQFDAVGVLPVVGDELDTTADVGLDTLQGVIPMADAMIKNFL